MLYAIPEKGTCLKGNPLAGYAPKRRDESGVAACQFLAYLESVGQTDTEKLALDSHVPSGTIYRWKRGEVAVIGLTEVDKVLDAIDCHIDELTIIPRMGRKDALMMAIQENLDAEDRLTADQAQIEARIEELLTLRDAILG